MNNKARLEKLEAKIIPVNNGLRQVIDFDSFYDGQMKKYWTDAPIENDISRFYEDKPFPEVTR